MVMRDSTILKEDGFLGPHSPRVRIADTQSLVFKNDDSGPFYLQRHDKPTGIYKLVERSKKLIIDSLKEAEV